MRIPSLTSDTSEASGDGEGAFGLRRASTVTQMTQEEVQEAEMEVSSSCTDADAEPVATVATDAEPVALHQVDGMDTNVQRQLVTLPRMHWLEVQESRICQRVSTSQVCWSEEVTPRQAGGAAGSLAKVVVRTKRWSGLIYQTISSLSFADIAFWLKTSDQMNMNMNRRR